MNYKYIKNIVEKIIDMIMDKHAKRSDIKPIHYVRSLNVLETPNNEIIPGHQDHYKDSSLYHDNKMIIDIEPSLFSDIKYDISNINDKWFINLSSTHVPENIKSLLQLGRNFSLPLTNKTKLTTNFIINFENNLINFKFTGIACQMEE